MAILKKTAWFLVALVAAFALSVIVGVFNPAEKVNAVWLLVAALCIYAIAFRFYAVYIASKVLTLDSSFKVPSRGMHDAHDYQPTNKWVLFGHHFAAISGAGPIIGPTLAAQFGFLPGFLWILIGAVLGGAVHDMVVLAASVRKDGQSLADIAKQEIGKIGGIATAFAILFNVVVAVAGSGLAVVNTLANSPWGTFTVLLTILIAVAMGIYLHYLRPGKVAEVSAIGAFLLLVAVYLGSFVPGSFLEPYFTLSRNSLLISLGVLCFLSSALPIWLLLLPRDYISSYIKIGTFVLIALGIIIMAPKLNMPPVSIFANGGPIIPGALFPFLFITIACGAISGFHGIIASGTTPKLVACECDIPLIGFGSMLTEGIVAVMCLIAATVLMPNDYFAINTTMSPDHLASLGFGTGKIAELSAAIGIDLKGRPGGPVSLAVGLSTILAGIIGHRAMLPFWYNFALMFQALFILTLVDAGTRVGRFLLQEIGGYAYKPIAMNRTTLNILITSLIMVSMWMALIFTGNISTIWPMFGIANQTLASIGFAIGTTMIIRRGNIKYAWITFIPMLFMNVVTFIASFQLKNIFLHKAQSASFSVALNLEISSYMIMFMVLINIVIIISSVYYWYSYISGKIPIEKVKVVSACGIRKEQLEILLKPDYPDVIPE